MYRNDDVSRNQRRTDTVTFMCLFTTSLPVIPKSYKMDEGLKPSVINFPLSDEDISITSALTAVCCC